MHAPVAGGEQFAPGAVQDLGDLSFREAGRLRDLALGTRHVQMPVPLEVGRTVQSEMVRG